jgi:hypothetical protein
MMFSRSDPVLGDHALCALQRPFLIFPGALGPFFGDSFGVITVSQVVVFAPRFRRSGR